MTQELPIIPVLIQLGPAFEAVSNPWRPTAGKLSWQISADLSRLVEQLGIPGRPEVEIEGVTSVSSLRIFVSGIEQRYSLELVQRISDYFSARGLSNSLLTTAWSSEVVKLVAEADYAAFLAALIVENVKEHPEVLLNREQVAAYLQNAQAQSPFTSEEGAARAGNVLRQLLSLKLAITDSTRILESIDRGIVAGDTDDDIVEEVATQICPRKLQIIANSSYEKNREAPQSGDGVEKSAAPDPLQLMTEGLFYELGVRLPHITLGFSEEVREAAFTVTINDVVSFPIRGLKADELLVNDIPANLEKLGIQGRSAINPANGNDCSIVHVADRPKVNAANLYVWDPLEYIILAVSRQIRRNAWRLLHLEALEHELGMLQQVFPDLVIATLEKIPLNRLTQILRCMVREEVSIRDLRTILDRLLNYDYVVADARQLIIFDDRLVLSTEPKPTDIHDPRFYAQFVRIGLKQYLTHKLSRGQNTLVVYLLEPEIERQIVEDLAAERGGSDAGRLTPERCQQILAAVRNEIGNAPRGGQPPVILTISEIRTALHALLEPEHPNLSVVAYDELRPDLNVQPIARITL